LEKKKKGRGTVFSRRRKGRRGGKNGTNAATPLREGGEKLGRERKKGGRRGKRDRSYRFILIEIERRGGVTSPTFFRLVTLITAKEVQGGKGGGGSANPIPLISLANKRQTQKKGRGGERGKSFIKGEELILRFAREGQLEVVTEKKKRGEREDFLPKEKKRNTARFLNPLGGIGARRV